MDCRYHVSEITSVLRSRIICCSTWCYSFVSVCKLSENSAWNPCLQIFVQSYDLQSSFICELSKESEHNNPCVKFCFYVPRSCASCFWHSINLLLISQRSRGFSGREYRLIQHCDLWSNLPRIAVTSLLSKSNSPNCFISDGLGTKFYQHYVHNSNWKPAE